MGGPAWGQHSAAPHEVARAPHSMRQQHQDGTALLKPDPALNTSPRAWSTAGFSWLLGGWQHHGTAHGAGGTAVQHTSNIRSIVGTWQAIDPDATIQQAEVQACSGMSCSGKLLNSTGTMMQACLQGRCIHVYSCVHAPDAVVYILPHLFASHAARQGAWKVWAQGGRRCSRSPASNGSRHTAQLGGGGGGGDGGGGGGGGF
jgi:hypothetical protein